MRQKVQLLENPTPPKLRPSRICWYGPVRLLGELRLSGLRAGRRGPTRPGPPMIRFDEYLYRLESCGTRYLITTTATESLNTTPGTIAVAVCRTNKKLPGRLIRICDKFYLLGLHVEGDTYTQPHESAWIDALMSFRGIPYRASCLYAANVLSDGAVPCKKIDLIVPTQIKRSTNPDINLRHLTQKEQYFNYCNASQHIRTERGPDGSYCIASRALTILDCVRYGPTIASFDHVRYAIERLGWLAEPRDLRDLARHYENANVRRAGFLLDEYGHSRQADALRDAVMVKSEYVKLNPQSSTKTQSGRRPVKDARWRIEICE